MLRRLRLGFRSNDLRRRLLRAVRGCLAPPSAVKPRLLGLVLGLWLLRRSRDRL